MCEYGRQARGWQRSLQETRQEEEAGRWGVCGRRFLFLSEPVPTHPPCLPERAIQRRRASILHETWSVLVLFLFLPEENCSKLSTIYMCAVVHAVLSCPVPSVCSAPASREYTYPGIHPVPTAHTLHMVTYKAHAVGFGGLVPHGWGYTGSVPALHTPHCLKKVSPVPHDGIE